MKKIATILSLIPLLLLLISGTNALGSEIHTSWFSSLSINFSFRIDSLSLIFLYLVNIIIPITLLSDTSRSTTLYVLILSLQWLLIGFFTARDLVFFTFFFEAMLLPLYFIIRYFGGPQREKASYTFIIYMIAGSTLMVAAVLGLYVQAHTFDIPLLGRLAELTAYKKFIFAAFMLAFAVKTPLFPFHSWLPDSYCQAPTSGTILLSALLSKAGIYGIARIGIGLFPTLMQCISPLLLTLSIIGVLYGACLAWAQTDFKRLIAYSSFSHVNFVLAGLFIWNDVAHSGAILQAVNHAITITGLFLVAYWLEVRIHSTSMKDASGLTAYIPILNWLTLFFVLSSIALPGLNNFVGEVMILFGIFLHNPYYAVILGLTVIFSVMYMLRFMQMMYFTTPNPSFSALVDIRTKELTIALPLIALIVWLGLYPAVVLEQIEKFLR